MLNLLYNNFGRKRRDMRTSRCLLLTLACFAMAQISFAADKDGLFFMGGGAGGVKCPDFVASMEKGRAQGINSLGYVQETQGFTMYILGFQTGYNMGSSNTYDIFNGIKSEYELLAKIEDYCRSNSSVRFGDAVIALAKAQHPKRKKNHVKSK